MNDDPIYDIGRVFFNFAGYTPKKEVTITIGLIDAEGTYPWRVDIDGEEYARGYGALGVAATSKEKTVRVLN